jgi:hypothetical protein
MKIYIAHNYAARQMLAYSVVPILTDLGHVITSRWITDYPNHDDGSNQTQQALIDLVDIDLADALLFFTHNYGNLPGKGKYVELGYAIGLNTGNTGMKKIFLFGTDDSCVFYHLPNLIRIKSLEEIPL